MVDDLNHEIKKTEDENTSDRAALDNRVGPDWRDYLDKVVFLYFCGRHYPFAFAIGQGALATSIEGEDLPGQGGGTAHGRDSFREGRYPGGIDEIGECLA